MSSGSVQQQVVSSFENLAISCISKYGNNLSHHEEEICKSHYNIKIWLLYLEEIDTLIAEKVQEEEKEEKKKRRLQQQPQLQPSNDKKNKNDNSNNNDDDDGMNSDHFYSQCVVELCRVRDFIGRRSVAALPGSYKLWKNHWEFLIAGMKNGWYHNNDESILPPPLDAHTNTKSNSTRNTNIDNEIKLIIQETFECALRTLHKYPRVWIDYFKFIWKYPPSDLLTTTSTIKTHNSHVTAATTLTTASQVTFLRRLANRSLQALPVTQHDRLWPIIIEYCTESIINIKNDDQEEGKDLLIWESCNRLLRRYVEFEPSYLPTLAQFYIQQQQWGEAALLYQQILQDHNNFYAIPASTKSGGADAQQKQQQEDDNNHDDEYDSWWTLLADVCCKHPIEVEKAGVPWENILREVLSEREDNKPYQITEEMKGLLWSKLADSWIRRGEFDLARSIYEEALEKVSTVRDFTILFDAYLKLEEGLLEAATEQMSLEEQQQQVDNDSTNKENNNNEKDAKGFLDDDDNYDWDILLDDNNLMDINSTKDNKKNDNNFETLLGDMEFALARAEHLTSRRPLMLNRVLLRQNPYNVSEWIKRSEMYINDLQEPEMAASTLHEAIQTIAIVDNTISNNKASTRISKRKKKAAMMINNGSISKLVAQLVKVYEEYLHNLDKARGVLNRICYNNTNNNNNTTTNNNNKRGIVEEVYYDFGNNVEDYAECWAIYVEFELRNENYDNALSLIRQAVMYSSSNNNNNKRRILNISRSLRLWDLLLDLEESLGTIQTAKDAYNRAIEIKVITPIQVLNFCSFLKDNKYFEESFTFFERSIELFPFPHPSAKILWKSYIQAFLDRYCDTDDDKKKHSEKSSTAVVVENDKIERIRDLFERCLENCPSKESTEFFLLFGQFEEKYGLTTRALKVYDTMCTKVHISNLLMSYQLYITKIIQYRGLTATRNIYQRAIESIQDYNNTDKNNDEEDKKSNNDTLQNIKNNIIIKLCIDFANMETSLHEVDRARAIFQYGSQLADPRIQPEYWKSWNEFEILYGNEETFREMLRIKRSVVSAFSTVNYNATDTEAASATTTDTKKKNSSNSKSNTLSHQEAMNMIADRDGVNLDHLQHQQPSATGGFVAASSTNNDKKRKQTADGGGAATTLDQVEERVAKLRKATAAAAHVDDEEIDIDDDDDDGGGGGDHHENKNADDNDEIDIDDDDEDDDDDTDNGDDENNNGKINDNNGASAGKSASVKEIVTKEVPAAVFGGLVKPKG